MPFLLDNAYAPLTFEWGLFEAPLERVVRETVQWRECHCSRVTTQPVRGMLAEMLPRLEPLTIGDTRALLVETASSWVAYFANNVQGAEATGPVDVISERLGCRGIVVTVIPNTLTSATGSGKGVYGAVGFEYYAPSTAPDGRVSRVATAYNDGGRWVWYAAGEPLPFEYMECYTARRVKDRLTPDMVATYGDALGLNLFDPAFYGPVGTFITLTVMFPPGARGYSLKQVQEDMGFR